VHEYALVAVASTMAGIAPAGTSMRSSSPPAASAKRATAKPFTITGSARPTKSGSRGAGEARIMGSVCCHRSPAMALPIANRQGMEPYCSALPIT
jgi:hypothetical protein